MSPVEASENVHMGLKRRSITRLLFVASWTGGAPAFAQATQPPPVPAAPMSQQAAIGSAQGNPAEQSANRASHDAPVISVAQVSGQHVILRSSTRLEPRTRLVVVARESNERCGWIVVDFAQREQDGWRIGGIRIGDTATLAGDTAIVETDQSTAPMPLCPGRKIPPQFLTPLQIEVQRENEYKRGQTLRDVGIAITSVGALSLPVSVAVIASTFCLFCSGDASQASDRGFKAGIAVGVIGVAALGVGIPLWAIGARRMEHSNTRAARLSPFVSPLSHGVLAGIALTRF